MKCPFCQANTKIYNSRGSHAGQQTWRRHRCQVCHRKFTTREQIDWNGVVSVTNDRESLPYSRQRLEHSIVKACASLQNALEAASGLTSTIEQQMAEKGLFNSPTLSGETIRQEVLTVLRRFDRNVALQYLNNVYKGNPPLEIVSQLLKP